MPAKPDTVREVDWSDPSDGEAVATLVNHYSLDPMGDGAPLPEAVRARIAPGLRSHPTARVFLAQVGAEAVGLAVCFVGFNTFAARPVLNVHDLIVAPDARGRGVGRALMEQVESVARGLDAYAITLEVRGDNGPAQALYRSLGFSGGTFDPPVAEYLFWSKELS